MLSTLLTAALAAQGTPIGFEETYALAADRAQAVATLTPGSSDWFYFRCRERQGAGDLDAVQQTLAEWTRALPEDGPRRLEIETRQALLAFTKDPAATFAFLQQRLGLAFDAVRNDPNAPSDLPKRLDPALLDRETLTLKALAKHGGKLTGFTPEALPWLATRHLDDEQLRELLVIVGREERAGLPGLPALVVRHLGDNASSGFGSQRIHRHLRAEQLDECARLQPQLLLDRDFVEASIARIARPSAEDLRLDPAARGVYLTQLWTFVQRLAPSFNSVKADVLSQHLEHDVTQGGPDKARFLAWLQLPRDQPWANAEFARTRPRDDWHTSSIASVTGMPPIASEEDLARRCLEHLFATEDSTEAYAPYVAADWLQRVFAETKLLLGQGDAWHWHRLIGSAERSRELAQRIEITFAPTLPRTFAANDRVVLEIDTKNVPALLVRLYAIDSFRWHQEKGTPVDLSLDLTSLVATHELTESYTELPIRRVRRRFELPQLDAPGTYIVECVGNGVRSRMLIHKGQLRCTEQPDAAGHRFRVYDEAGVHLKDAAIWFGGRDYSANQDGEIVLPFTTEPGPHKVVLHRGERSDLRSFRHAAESYQLTSRFHVDRESLVAGAHARLLVRARLELAGREIPIGRLRDATLSLVAKDLDGVTTRQTVRDLKLVPDRDYVHEFSVPERLRTIEAMLWGNVHDLEGNERLCSSRLETFEINHVDETAATSGEQLVPTAQGYVLEVRGKDGEPKSNHAIAVKLWVEGFQDEVTASLRTDDGGRIHLGHLPGVYELQFSRGEHWRVQTLPRARCNLPAELHGLAGTTLRLPYQGRSAAPTRDDLSLLGEDRDAFDHLAIAGGFLELRDLPAGQYLLQLHDRDVKVQVRIARGVRDGGWLLDRELSLEASDPQPLHLPKLELADGELRVTVANATSRTRLAVVATRYDAPFRMFTQLGVAPQPLARHGDHRHAVELVTGIALGEEDRYVLERRFATKFPGNMLTRPSLLLNPLDLALTEGRWRSGGKYGSRFGKGGAGGKASQDPGARNVPSPQHPGALANVDYLPRASVMMANLVPDTHGIVRVKLADLGEGQCLHVLALDGEQAVYDTILREEQPLVPRRRHLQQALDAAQHFTEQKGIEFVAAGGAAPFADAQGTATALDSLASVHTLLSTGSTTGLAEFAFVLSWPKLTPEQKRQRYSKHACHELHFLLFHKDPEFFAAVCKPFLANKLHKTFLDHWLLGDDLTSFLEPWAFKQLNLIEKILLARRLDAPRRDAIVRCLREALELRPVDARALDRLLDQALAANQLERGAAHSAEPGRPATEEGKEKEAAPKLQDQDVLPSDTPRALYRGVLPTRLFVEHNWWHRRLEQCTPDVVAPNHFWIDYATAPAGQPFVSSAIVEAGG
ncbi:MAG TPA: hypothetical protein VF384_06135, partial [Planctomycetota bacterium]